MEDQTNKYTLKNPVVLDGETVSELDLDFDSLTADDILSSERQFNTEATKNKEFVPIKETSKSYLAFIVARAAKQPVENIRKLSAKDFSQVTVLAQNFLLG